MKPSNEQLNFRVVSAPKSADPLAVDLILHNEVYSSVLSTLVTNYKRGHFVGLLAESWSASIDQKAWKFKMRAGLEFEDGESITAENAGRSILRVAKITAKRGSQNGLVEFLEGSEKLATADQIPGISWDSDSVTLRFTKPRPVLLDQLSFGLYAVVSPKDFDAKTLEWKAGARPTASGAYRLERWEEKSLALALRPQYPRELLHPHPYKTVVFDWDPAKAKEQDLFFLNRSASIGDDFEFMQAGLRDIYYISASHPNDSSNLLHDLAARRWLRQLFFDFYTAKGFSPPQWFIPGFENMKDPDTAKRWAKPPAFTAKQIKCMVNPAQTDRILAIMGGLRDMSAKSGLEFVGIPADQNLYLQSGIDPINHPSPYDLELKGTQIRVDGPEESIRFMFLSKEGIRLPDTDGRITEELKKDKLDIPKINRLIWEQAAVWPTLHPETGYFARKAAGVDLSLLNLSEAPTQIQWIGRKE